jgi:hypothetical protein
MYAQVDQFAVDKALNTIVEEGIAPPYIREYWARQGRRVSRVEKNLGDLAQSRKYDLSDTFGTRWEVKYDRLWHVTGNVYVELQALENSEADMYLVFAGPGFAIAKSRVWEAIQGLVPVAGGDEMRSLGAKLPVERLAEFAEEVIVL